jgi:hypothetical protein
MPDSWRTRTEGTIDNITVNALVPAMWTPMYDEFRAHLTPETLAAHDATMAGLIPLGGRLGDPDRDLGPVMVFRRGVSVYHWAADLGQWRPRLGQVARGPAASAWTLLTRLDQA